jgi:hypothetical protein
MCNCKSLKWITALLLSAVISLPSIAQEKNAPKNGDKAASDQAGGGDMMAMMMELAKPGENHKLLAGGVGSWTYTVKWWMSPDAAPSESMGTTVTRATMGGRYFISEHTGKMQMPGPDGKMMDMEFKGMATEGYDNVKKKFVASWIDNMGTGIIRMEGDYDAATKSLTYRAEQEMMPGMKMKIREVIKFTDKDHRMFEWYEDRDGKEVKTMEIAYTRKS